MSLNNNNNNNNNFICTNELMNKINYHYLPQITIEARKKRQLYLIDLSNVIIWVTYIMKARADTDTVFMLLQV